MCLCHSGDVSIFIQYILYLTSALLRWPETNTVHLKSILINFTFNTELGDNCIHKYHLVRYIIGYKVGNLVYGDGEQSRKT